MNAGRSSIDWEDAKRRLAALAAALSRDERTAGAEAESILRQRAARLAETIDEPEESGDGLEVVVMELAGERFALEAAVIREVVRLSPIARLPDTPAHFAGMINLHGRPLLIVDLRGLLGLEGEELGESARVVVVGEGQAEFGVLAEATEEVATVRFSHVSEAPRSLPAAARRLLLGVTGEAVTVLDAGRLLSDPRLWIEQQND